MKFVCVSFLFTFLTFSTIAQEATQSIPFVAYWQAGDSYDFKVTKIKKQWENGNFTKNDSTSYQTNFLVLEETESEYTIQWSYQKVFSAAIPGPLEKQLTEGIPSQIIYKTDETGIFKGIENWQEIAKAVNSIFSHLTIEGELEEQVANAVKPILNALNTKEGVEMILFKELQYLHFPFGIEYTMGEDIAFTELLPNSFGGDPIKGNSTISLHELDQEKSTCTLLYEMILDPEDTKRAILDLLARMGQSNDEFAKALGNMQFDMRDQNVLKYFYNPGIPINIEFKRETLLTHGGEKVIGIEITRIELIE